MFEAQAGGKCQFQVFVFGACVDVEDQLSDRSRVSIVKHLFQYHSLCLGEVE